MSTKRHLVPTERQRQAFELRMAGMHFQDIAHQLGYRGASGAYHAVKTALARMQQEPVELVRTLELSRLDQIQLQLWPLALNDSLKLIDRLKAIDRILKVMDRRARLLGLKTPTMIASTDPAGERPITIEHPSLKAIMADPRLASMAGELAIAMDNHSRESNTN